MEKKKVLIIDDEDVHLYTAKGLIESDRIEVATYRGSFGATNCVRAVEPDLILLDINMPALSGENLVSLIKANCPEKTKILFYSSNDEVTLKKLAAVHGISGYIAKGDVSELQAVVNQILGLTSATPV